MGTPDKVILKQSCVCLCLCVCESISVCIGVLPAGSRKMGELPSPPTERKKKAGIGERKERAGLTSWKLECA